MTTISCPDDVILTNGGGGNPAARQRKTMRCKDDVRNNETDAGSRCFWSDDRSVYLGLRILDRDICSLGEKEMEGQKAS